VCVPESVLPHKVQAMRELGAEVRVVGPDQERAEVEALAISAREGLTWISPFDDPWVIAGQGTIGLELLEEMPQVEVVLAPLSGGGLMGGIALAVKSADHAIRTIGVTMERGPAMVASLAAGQPVQVREEATLADSLVGGIGLENHFTLDLIRRVVDETVLVSEAEIARAMVYALQQEKLVVEGGGAVALAALLANKVDVHDKRVACIVSGGNVNLTLLTTLIAEQRAANAKAL
jgi:threonine dehydratase